MSDYYKQTKQETIIYTIVWLVIFLAPLSEFLVNYDPEHPFWIKTDCLTHGSTCYSSSSLSSSTTTSWLPCW